jgi:hypothetical protein
MAASGKHRQAAYRVKEREAGHSRLDVAVSRATVLQLHQLAQRYGATHRFVLSRLIQLAVDDLKLGVIR